MGKDKAHASVGNGCDLFWDLYVPMNRTGLSKWLLRGYEIQLWPVAVLTDLCVQSIKKLVEGLRCVSYTWDARCGAYID